MKCSAWAVMGVMAGLTGGAWAQTQAQPSAGSLLQQIEGNRRIELPPRLLPEGGAGTPSASPPSSQGPAYRIQRFRFVGNTVLSPQDFEPLLAEYAGQALDLRQLRDVLGPKVAELYRSKGWVVSISLQEPVQPEASEAVYNIVEARLGQTLFEGQAPSRVNKDMVLEFFQRQLSGQNRLNNLQVDRALLLAGDLPGVVVAARQRAGQSKGSTDVVVTAQDKPAWAGDITVDNTGSRATGAERVALNAEWRSPTGRADALTTSLMHTQGSDYGRLGYTVPVGRDGLRVGANASKLSYQVVSPESRTLGAHGSSDSVGLDLNYPLIRARDRNLYLNAAYDHKGFDNRTSTGITSDYTADNLTLGLTGNLFDNWGGGGANTASLSMVNGRLNLDGSPNQGGDASTFKTQGQFSKLRYNFSRQQTLTPSESLFVSYTGQIANKNLDGSEKLYLGGASGVRAYPTSEAGGNDGHMINLELRSRLRTDLDAAAFYDWGQVRQYRDHAPVNNTLALKGYGASLSWRSAQGLILKATWAHRQGNNPNPLSTGNDQDGSLEINRFWLSANYAF